jgi:2-polyprenyl-6-methoxyphenol hydroxylase-like FAD-dependent oxidoreductase
MGEEVSAFPYLVIYPLDVHEPMLIAALAEAGVAVDWRTSLVGFAPGAEGVTATLERDGQPEVIRADWLVGADSGRSTVREGLGIGFEGGTAEGLFYVAEVRAEHLGHTVVLGFGTSRFAVLLPLPGGRAQLIGMVPPGSDADGRFDFQDVASDARRLTELEAQDVAWFSTYHVRHCVAARFRQGRCFLAGDAGHVHSPLGGQGMNTGIGDALNLAWKLGAVVRGEASAAILDSYEAERLPFARRLVATTDAAFLRVADDSWVGRTTRTRICPPS